MTDNIQKSNIGDIVSITVGDFMVFNDTRTYSVDANSNTINLPFNNQILINGNGYQPIQFINNYGSTPTGITSGQTYWVIPSTLTDTSFKVATSIDNAVSDKAISISNDQSGKQFCVPYANVVVSSGSVYSPVGVNVLALNLSEGEWEVWGNIVWSNALVGTGGTPNYLSAGFSTTSSTLVPTWSSSYTISAPSFITGWMTQNISPVYFRPTEPSLVYMVGQATGSPNSGYLGACGYMIAKRTK